MTEHHPAGSESYGSSTEHHPAGPDRRGNMTDLGATAGDTAAVGTPGDPYHAVRACRVRLSRIIEPGDTAGLILLAALGPELLWRSIVELQAPSPALCSVYRKATEELAPDSSVPNLLKRFAAWRSRLPVPEPRVDARHA